MHSTIRLLVVLLVAIVLAGSGGEMLGPIDMQAGALTDEEWQVVRHEFDGSDGEGFLAYRIEQYVSEGVADTPEDAWDLFRRESVYGARIDLNGDGRLELVVLIEDSGYCGTAGCLGFVYARSEGHLEAVHSPDISGPSLCLSGRGPGGMPYLFTGSSALWWTGSRYESVFINLDNGEFFESRPGMRALVYALRQMSRTCFDIPDQSLQ